MLTGLRPPGNGSAARRVGLWSHTLAKHLATSNTQEVAMTTGSPTRKHATLWRMVMPGHLCPFGLKSKWLLRHKGYTVEDHHLKSRAETDAFMPLKGSITPTCS